MKRWIGLFFLTRRPGLAVGSNIGSFKIICFRKLCGKINAVQLASTAIVGSDSYSTNRSRFQSAPVSGPSRRIDCISVLARSLYAPERLCNRADLIKLEKFVMDFQKLRQRRAELIRQLRDKLRSGDVAPVEIL